MIHDILTIFWKEWREIKELIWQRGSGRGSGLRLIAVFGIVGGYLPWQFGIMWIESPLPVIYGAFYSIFMVTSIIVDCFAGERERHTLETLLASRIPDYAILLGKLTATISYGMCFVIIIEIIGLFAANLNLNSGMFVNYSALTILSILLISFLGSWLMAEIGLFLSLRASTVRQVTQNLNTGIMVVFLVANFGFTALPKTWKETILHVFNINDGQAIMYIITIILLVIDVIILFLTTGTFKREKLAIEHR